MKLMQMLSCTRCSLASLADHQQQRRHPEEIAAGDLLSSSLAQVLLPGSLETVYLSKRMHRLSKNALQL
jgi:hypothetical protein